LYVSTIDENGDWGPAENLGPEINSPFDDEYPFILKDGKTLYFSSQGHYNIGGHDIFYSTMNDAGEWTAPINLGYPINTMDDDVFFQPIGDGKEAYIALETYEGMGGKDIYKLFISQSTFGDFGSQEFLSTKNDTLTFPMNLADLYRVNDRIDSSSIREVIKYVQPTNEELPVATAITTNNVIIKGRIILADNNLVDTTFTLDIIDPNILKTRQRIKPEVETGKYVFKSLLNELTLEAKGNGYKMATKKVIIPENYSMPEMIVNITMYPEEVASGEYYKIKSIFFDYGKADLKRESQIELEKLYALMKKNPTLYVEVIGFTDSWSSASFNKKLSEKRARAAIDYLVGKGISVERFVAKGMGESSPIAINNNPDGSDNPEGRQLNRRVDIKLLNTDIANVVIEPVYVPENLAYKGNTRRSNNKNKQFYILLSVQKEKFNKNVECKYKEVKTNKGYVYTLGSFTDKSSAIKLLNKAIDNGFADAKIITDDEYKTITKVKDNSVASTSKKSVYSIQIKALSHPVKISQFTNIKGIKEYLGADGFYRYTYKEFKTKEEARKHLSEVTGKGFPDAFIIDIKKYKQREIKGNAEYTIQLKALKNPINIKFFSNLKGVREFIANDGYYKYTIGSYKTMDEARKSLQNIRAKGYKDAFIVNVEKYN
jgi:outer membrane protein OmpA-like peptidoglycan-associated protein